jgi:hypothetical protein
MMILALNDATSPYYAIMNADNQEYFAENSPWLK